MEYPLTFETFQQGLEEGILWGVYCRSCETYTVPAQGVCPNCRGWQLIKTEIRGEGLIRTFTVIRVAPEGRQSPYSLVLVELDQGPWVIGNLLGVPPEKMEIGLIGKRVHLEFSLEPDSPQSGESQVLRFRLEGGPCRKSPS
jgi:uncharacterized protein